MIFLKKPKKTLLVCQKVCQSLAIKLTTSRTFSSFYVLVSYAQLSEDKNCKFFIKMTSAASYRCVTSTSRKCQKHRLLLKFFDFEAHFPPILHVQT